MLFEGPWNELEVLSDLQWFREAADLDAVMVELGRDDFASWVGGRYNVRMVGGAGTAAVMELGALPFSIAEKSATEALQLSDFIRNYRVSPRPPDDLVAPVRPFSSISEPGPSELSVASDESGMAPGLVYERMPELSAKPKGSVKPLDNQIRSIRF